MNTNKQATGSPKRLLAALAVLAVAFVMLAAVPAVDADGDDVGTTGVGGSATESDDSFIKYSSGEETLYYGTADGRALTEKINAATSDVTLTILRDLETSYDSVVGYDLNMGHWTLDTAQPITLDGNGITLTKLTVPLFGMVRAPSLTIEDVKVKGCTILPVETQGYLYCAAALIGNTWHSTVTTVTNCSVKDCVIGDGTTSFAGALLAYSNEGADATVQNCSVEGCTVVGGNAGGISGQPQAGIVITDCEISDSDIVGTNAKGLCAGIAVGVLNGDDSSVFGLTTTGCTVSTGDITLSFEDGADVTQFVCGVNLKDDMTVGGETIPAGVWQTPIAQNSVVKPVFTVSDDWTEISADWEIPAGIEVTVPEDSTLVNTADITGAGKLVVKGNLTNDAEGSITAIVEAEEGSTITNNGTMDSLLADEVYTKSIVEGDVIVDAEYGYEQRVVVTGNATVKGYLTVHGEIAIEGGATLTVEPGAVVTIDGARTSVIEGTLVLEDGDTPARFDIGGSAKVEVSGSLSVAGDLTVNVNASITFKAGSSTEVGGTFSASKAVVEADASLTVAGAVGAASNFYVAGILTIESEDVSESFNVYFSAAGATLDIKSVVMANGGEIMIKDKGTVLLDSSNSEPEAAVYTGAVTISLTSAAGKIMPAGKTLADDVDSEGEVYEVEHAAVLNGLKVVDSMEPVAAVAATSTPAKNVYTMQLSGTVLVDQNIEYTGLGTAVGYATAKIEVADGTTAAVRDALAIGAGVGFSNAGVLKVLSSIDATASGTQNTIVKDESDEPSGLAGTFGSGQWDSAVIKAVAVSATMTNTGRIVLSGEGSVTTAVKVVVDSASFSGAYYETSVTSGTTRIVTYHYVTVDAALAALTAGATDDVKLYGEQTVGADATILSKDTIALGDAQAKLTIGKDATLTVADGGKLVATTDNSVVVKGTLHVDVYKQFVSYINAVDSDVYSYDADAKGVQDNKSWAEWTSIKNALDKADSGQTVTVNPNKETVEIGENTEVKEGVTLDANGKTISVKQTYTLTVNGTLDLTKSGSSLTLAAKTPAQPATSTTPAVAAVAGGAVVYDSGVVKYTDDGQIVRNGANLPGAFYSMTENGRTVKYLASYAQGAKDIASAVGRAVTFSADGASAGVVISSDLAITGEKDKTVALTITGAKLTAGTITLSYATVDVASGTVSATFASADGSAKVAGAATGLKAVHGDCTVGDDTVTALQISGALADVDNAACSATMSGTVYIVGNLGVGSTLTIADDADVVVAGSADVDAETLSVAGNLTVKSGAVDAVAADVSGGIAVQGGVVTMTTATVSGSIDASNKDTSGSYTGTVAIETAYIGTDAEALGFTTGSDASVIGNIVLSKVAYVSPAATVTSEWTAEGSAIKSTKYVDENGADYLTVFAAVGDVLIADIGKTVPNADFLGWFNAAGKKAVKVASSPAVDGEEVAYVGGTGWDSVVTKINEFVFNVKIVTDGTVSSVTLNGILMSGSGTFNTADPIKAGTYTVAFSAGAGYDVSGMTLSTSQGVPINGFEITVDDSTTSSDRTVTYQLTGGTAAAPSGGSSSSGSDFSGIIDAIDKNTEAVKNQENGGGSDSSLTDILLIVLVVLIVIMAVLVAMRMMRS